jgi:hypothetical protein
MADYSSLYPTLSRNKNGDSSYGPAAMGDPSGSAGAPLSTSPGSPGGSPLGTLGDVWDSSGNFTGEPGVPAEDASSSPWAGLASKGIASFAPLALSLFAPKTQGDIPGGINNAVDKANALDKTGQTTSAQGAEALNPVLHYLAAVTSGDPQALLAATAPQRRKVIDQYDTARQAAQFAPRGGGTSSAVVNANTRQAGDLAQVNQTAQSEGMKTAAAVGEALTGQGANAQSASVGHLTQLLQPLIQNQQNDQASTFKTFASIASMIGMFVL